MTQCQLSSREEFDFLHEGAVLYMRTAQEASSRAYRNVVEIINRELYREAGFSDWKEYARHFLDECGLVNIEISTIQQKLRTNNRLALWAEVDEDTVYGLSPRVANALESLASAHNGWERRKNGEPSGLVSWDNEYTRDNVVRFLDADPEADDKELVRDLVGYLSELSVSDAVRTVEELKKEPGSSIIELGHITYDHESGRPRQFCSVYRRNSSNQLIWQWKGDIWGEPFPREIAEDIAQRERVQFIVKEKE